jgi:cytochrome c-type biogenesis protein CcmH/NrfF
MESRLLFETDLTVSCVLEPVTVKTFYLLLVLWALPGLLLFLYLLWVSRRAKSDRRIGRPVGTAAREASSASGDDGENDERA